jgi:peptide/nickel transport system ATP-binding protein/oligopeptide transport system ATP-binding protein
MALSCEPKLLIADEPSTALDVSVQAQIIELLAELSEGSDMSVLLITHDLAVVSQMAGRVVVMYAGAVVEESPVAELFDSPLHPYTKGLIDSLPRLGQKLDRLPMIPGTVPDPLDLPSGCRFGDRCPSRFEKCSQEPPLIAASGGRMARCWLCGGEGR